VLADQHRAATLLVITALALAASAAAQVASARRTGDQGKTSSVAA